MKWEALYMFSNSEQTPMWWLFQRKALVQMIVSWTGSVLMQHFYFLLEIMSSKLWFFRPRYLADIFFQKWTHHFEGASIISRETNDILLLMIKFELSREYQNFWKTWIDLHDRSQCLKDSIDEIGGYINTCDFFVYYVMKHVNIWRFWITPWTGGF